MCSLSLHCEIIKGIVAAAVALAVATVATAAATAAVGLVMQGRQIGRVVCTPFLRPLPKGSAEFLLVARTHTFHLNSHNPTYSLSLSRSLSLLDLIRLPPAFFSHISSLSLSFFARKHRTPPSEKNKWINLPLKTHLPSGVGKEKKKTFSPSPSLFLPCLHPSLYIIMSCVFCILAPAPFLFPHPLMLTTNGGNGKKKVHHCGALRSTAAAAAAAIFAAAAAAAAAAIFAAAAAAGCRCIISRELW